VLRGWLAGVPLTRRHVTALDALVTQWHGQGPAALPGGIRVTRRDGRMFIDGD
jgi:tRNA(Ile)-lysidine synthase